MLAMSAGSANLPRGILSSRYLWTSSCEKYFSVISVVVHPGQIELTVILCLAHSTARSLVKAIMAPLLET